MKNALILRIFSISVFCLLLSQSIFAQSKRISGRVTDSLGAGLSGVSIRAKNANSGGGTTDVNGNYSVILPAG